MFLLLLACAESPPPADKAQDSATPVDSADTAPPCTPAAAVFFDLGETLVTQQADGRFSPLPGAWEALTALADQGLSTGIITNVEPDWTRADLEALLTEPEMLDAVDVLLLSSEASASKPDPIIFAEAVARLSPPPPIAHTLFVTERRADLADADPPTEGAQAAGMIGVWLSDHPADPRVDLQWSPANLDTLPAAPWITCLPAD